MGLNIAITGSTGLVGTAAVNYFKIQGHSVTRVHRALSDAPVNEPSIFWDVKAKKVDPLTLEGQDVVIHLAGASIADKRWSNSYKKLIYSSRIDGTKLLCNALAQCQLKPKVIICASAIGYYGNDKFYNVKTESSPTGDDYLAQVCHDWEAQTKVAQEAGIRVVNMRLGAVLSRKGGALSKMWVPFMLGAGGKLGSGKQAFSWIALNEIPLIMNFLIQSHQISGPVNVVAPNSVTNLEFTKILGKVIKRPTIFPVPAFGARLLFGEMADALLLGGVNVSPKCLLDNHYQFQFPELESALEVAIR